MKVLDVTYLKDYSIQVLFEDGVKGTVDLRDLTDHGIFRVLQDQSVFSKVYTTGYSIAWTDEMEIDAATVYAELSGKDPSAAFSTTPAYATN